MEHVGSAIAGGALIGLAASLLMLANGRVAGVSGMIAGLLPPERGGAWVFRALFLAGLVGAGAIGMLVAPQLIGPSPRALPWLIVAGLLVGFGTRIGSGCTSGHGVCGVSRLSRRSLVATAVFMACGILTASVIGALS